MLTLHANFHLLTGWLVCHNILKLLTSRYNDIVKDNSADTKRSEWISGIGTIFKTQNRTAGWKRWTRWQHNIHLSVITEYDNAIQLLQKDSKFFSRLWKDFTMITKSALQNYNETISIININEARLNSADESC